MKEPELYEMVRLSVENRRNNKAKLTPLTSRDDFYKSQLSRRKLIPQTSQIKRKKLFNMFEMLDSFIDISEILRMSIKEDQGELDNRALVKTYKCIDFTLENNDKGLREDAENQLYLRVIEKASKKLKNLYQQQSYLKNNKCEGILRDLQRTSTKVNSYLKNDQNSQTLTLLKNIERDDNFSMKKNQFKKSQEKKSSHKKQIKIDRIKYTNLLRKASTYLQIVLENEHQKKWYPKGYCENKKIKKINIKKSSNSHQLKSMKGFKTEPSTNRRKSSKMKELDEEKLQEEKNEENLLESERMQNLAKSMLKKTVNACFTFKKRCVKTVVMEKLQNFMRQVEDTEKLLRRENKELLTEIEKLNEYIEVQYQKFNDESYISLDQKLSNIKELVEERCKLISK